MNQSAAQSDRAAAVLEGLDAEQRAVATTFGAPVVVLAGAGTGKTRAITHRIAHGALSGQLRAEHTLAVTFTTKAAGELRHRLQALGVPRVQARTFHSAALRQLSYFWPRVYGTELPEVIGNSFGLVAEAARPLGVELSTPLLRDLVGEVGWTKASQVAPDRYAEIADRTGRSVAGLNPEQVAQVVLRYEQVKKRRAVIDFDDILLCTIALLAEHSEVAEQVHHQYRHFTVDEFQDVSPVQRTLLELWLGDRDDICVVGDLNQAIHTFAGAQPAYLASFDRDHPGAITLKLQTNYRSTPQVLAAANAMLGRGLRLRPVRPEGPAIEMAPAADEASEAAEVAAWLTARHAEGLAWSQLGVLYRINAQAEQLTDALAAAQIPYRVRDPELGRGAREAKEPGEADLVTLSTMHSAKGLEWEAVAIVGASEGLMPFALANTPAAVAEEKRLFYVAITRARTRLRISWASGGASGRGNREPSRFLRQARLAEANSPRATAKPDRQRKRRGLPKCWVCQTSLSDAAEIKLGRHVDCAADFDDELFDELKAWRLRTAQAQSVPAFVIFTDATLRALAERRPTDQRGLLQVQGIGATKAERHGTEVLELISARA